MKATRILLLLASLSGLTPLIAAPAPFTYQGRLSDQAGPATGTFDFTFSLHPDLNGDAVNGTWPFGVNGVPVTNGLFTVVLDFGDVAFDGSARYLQVSVRSADVPSSFTTLAPRQPLLPAPQAAFATRAGQVANNSVTPVQLATPVPPQPGQLLSYSGGQLVWSTPAVSSNVWGLGGNDLTTPGQHFLGTRDARPLEIRVNNAPALRFEPTADTPNLLGGFGGNFSQSNLAGVTIGGGGTGLGHQPNAAVSNAHYATIGGGYSNVVAGYGARIGGGSTHRAVGAFASIDGGQFHQASGDFSSIGGGFNNRVAGQYATLGGGLTNVVDGYCGTTAGGRANFAGGTYSTVGGGGINRATGLSATVAGGFQNEAQGQDTFIGGGLANLSAGLRSVVSGGAYNLLANQYSTIGGGLSNYLAGASSVIGGGEMNSAYGAGATVTGGARNELSGSYAVIDGGHKNTNNGASCGFIVGGLINQLGLGAEFSGILGGYYNEVSSNVWGAAVLAGFSNTIASDADAAATVAGYNNVVGANSAGATILGGHNNGIIHGPGSSILAGVDCSVAGGNSVAAGTGTVVNHDHCFAWGDGGTTVDAAETTGTNQFVVRATGGVRLTDHTSQYFGAQTRQMLNLWNTNYGIGVQAGTLYFRAGDDLSGNGFAWYLGGAHEDGFYSPGGGRSLMTLKNSGLSVNGTFVSLSDRHAKTNFTQVDPREILAALDRVPVQRWSYKEDPDTRHIGPVAQDFHAAFQVGANDTTIATVDADGVALAAIQALHQLLREKEEHFQALERRLADLEGRLGSGHLR